MYTESYPLTATWQVLQFKLLIPARIIALWNVHCDCLRKEWAEVLQYTRSLKSVEKISVDYYLQEEIRDLCFSLSHGFNSCRKNHDECYIF